MKRFLLIALVSLLTVPVAESQRITDNYHPGGFDGVGASYKTFSVSDTSTVQFSRGNLQYNAALNKWRFALRQYFYACSDNANIAQDYDGWVDQFAWGTSGWNSGVADYQPWSTSIPGDHILGGDASNNLTDAYAKADWGIYNRIENGGHCAGMWRTLTRDEWFYLIDPMNSHASRTGKCALATIGGVYKGLLILPDDWTLPSGCSYTAGTGNQWATNKYSYAEWEKMQAAGAVFLPAAGNTSNGSTYGTGEYGLYWSSTTSSSNAFVLDIENNSIAIGSYARYYQISVRLVRAHCVSEEMTAQAFDANGASTKRFTVSEGHTVSFSRGNLQYQASTGTWRFAENQWDTIGAANSNISETYDGWIDLFGWGTSGWNSGANAYQPWSTSEMSEDYFPGGIEMNNLTGEYANSDWGVYNAISNGGNTAGMWRTLTFDEWNYLVNTRTASTVSGTEDARCAKATIGGVAGLIIFPDSFTKPAGVEIENINTTNAAFDGNTYTTEQWTLLERSGVIFLPAAGLRDDGTVSAVGTCGRYWSSIYWEGHNAYDWYFGGDGISGSYSACCYGRSVRLVRD